MYDRRALGWIKCEKECSTETVRKEITLAKWRSAFSLHTAHSTHPRHIHTAQCSLNQQWPSSIDRHGHCYSFNKENDWTIKNRTVCHSQSIRCQFEQEKYQ